MQEREGVGVNIIWAITMIIVVALIAGAIYFSGILGKGAATPDKNIDVDVSLPAAK